MRSVSTRGKLTITTSTPRGQRSHGREATSGVIGVTSPTEASPSPEPCLPRLRLLTSIMRSAKLCTRSASRFCSSSSYLQKNAKTRNHRNRGRYYRPSAKLTFLPYRTFRFRKLKRLTINTHSLFSAITSPASTSSIYPSPCEASFIPILHEARRRHRQRGGWAAGQCFWTWRLFQS